MSAGRSLQMALAGVLLAMPALAAPDVPPNVAEEVDQIVGAYAEAWDGTDQQRHASFADLIEQTYPDVVAPNLGVQNAAWERKAVVAELVYRVHRLELERTDKQEGSSSKASGSTSAVEKAGINWLLGLAFETGAITQEENKTGVTLSTGPYAFLTLAEKDTPALYERYDLLRRFGVSASFATDSAGDAADRNFDPSALTELSAKYVIVGDRSTRSKWFVQEWKRDPDGPGPRKSIEALMHERLQADVGLIGAAMGNGGIRSIVDGDAQSLIVDVGGILEKARADAQDGTKATHKLTIKEKRSALDGVRGKITSAVVAALKKSTDAFDPAKVSDEDRLRLSRAMDAYVATRVNFEEEDARMQEILAELASTPLVTAGYTFHRKKDDADYSEVKVLAEYSLLDPDTKKEMLTFVGNASLSLNHDHSRIPTKDDGSTDADMPAEKGKRRDTVRDFSISLAIEKKIPNFLPFRVNAGGANEIVLSLNGKFMRLENEKDEIGVAQAKATFPLATGVDLPISVTYATRSEYVDEDEVRGNFGVSVDTDKLWSLAKLATGE